MDDEVGCVVACSIYRVVCAANGKGYIGQTWKTLAKRFRCHINDATSGLGHCVKLVRAILKHGEDQFSIELLATVETQELADQLERQWIIDLDTIRSGYNLREGGAHGKLAESTKVKMRAAHKGKIITAETRAKISATLTGRKNGPYSLEHRRRIGDANRGKKASPEHRAKMVAAHTGKKLSPKHRAAQIIGKRKMWATMPEEKRREWSANSGAARGRWWAAMSDEQRRAFGAAVSAGKARAKEKIT
jgi:group I intron endonuclease